MSAPSTVEECRRWLNGGRRHRCAQCDGSPVRKITAIVREGGAHRVVVACHGEVASMLISDSHVESQSASGSVEWFGHSRTADQIARLDRHGRITSGENTWQDSSAPYRQTRGEKR